MSSDKPPKPPPTMSSTELEREIIDCVTAMSRGGASMGAEWDAMNERKWALAAELCRRRERANGRRLPAPEAVRCTYSRGAWRCSNRVSSFGRARSDRCTLHGRMKQE